mgnify:CR=1 FL=1|jgi:hypothetical protein
MADLSGCKCFTCAKKQGEDGVALMVCAQCKIYYFCDKECQKIGWTEMRHKKECKRIKMVAEKEGKANGAEFLLSGGDLVGRHGGEKFELGGDFQFAFERADLDNDHNFFSTHWGRYGRHMQSHAMRCFPIFQWKNYRAWLERHKASTDSCAYCMTWWDRDEIKEREGVDEHD